MPGRSAPVDTVVMPGHERDGARPHAGGPGAGGSGARGPVELVGDLDRPGAWMLLAGGVPQSHVDLDDPLHLELEYMLRLGHLIDLAAPAGEPLRVLHLGGGALTLARYVAATRPGSHQLAVEADPGVARLVRRRLPLPPPGGPRPGAGKITGRVVRRGRGGRLCRGPDPGPPDVGGVHPRRGQGAGTARDLRGQRRRRPA